MTNLYDLPPIPFVLVIILIAFIGIGGILLLLYSLESINDTCYTRECLTELIKEQCK